MKNIELLAPAGNVEKLETATGCSWKPKPHLTQGPAISFNSFHPKRERLLPRLRRPLLD